jgi:hypothetical protein
MVDARTQKNPPELAGVSAAPPLPNLRRKRKPLSGGLCGGRSGKNTEPMERQQGCFGSPSCVPMLACLRAAQTCRIGYAKQCQASPFAVVSRCAVGYEGGSERGIGCSLGRIGQPIANCCPGLFGDLKLDRPPGFLLDYRGAVLHSVPDAYVAHPNPHEVAAPQLAVDGEIEQSEVASALFKLRPDPNAPNLLSFAAERGSGASSSLMRRRATASLPNFCSQDGKVIR